MTNNPDMQPTVTEALLPCPFCGGEALRFTIGEDEPNNAGGDVITCTKCQASSHVEFGRKENLVDRWNTRTPSQDTARSADVGREGVTFEQAWSQKEAEGYNYGHDALEQVRFGWEMALASLATPPADSEKVENRFSQWSNTGLAGQCRMQARDQLDPEFSQFMIAVAERIEIAALTTPPAADEKLLNAAVNQNDAMRQELSHVGNLVSDLARAMGVDQADADGGWPDLAGRINKLIDHARTARSADVGRETLDRVRLALEMMPHSNKGGHLVQWKKRTMALVTAALTTPPAAPTIGGQ